MSEFLFFVIGVTLGGLAGVMLMCCLQINRLSDREVKKSEKPKGTDTILLQDYITFEEISDFEVRATIRYKGQTASGIFTFNEQYEMISFTTNDRAVTGTDGSMEYVPWSALCNDYQLSKNGMKYPTKFQAVWNYPDGDFVYFDGIISEVSYGYKQ